MGIDRGVGKRLCAGARRQFVMVAAAAMLGAGLAASAAGAGNEGEGLSDDDKICLGCHGTEGMTSKLANGDTLSLTIDGAAFARSIHRPVGCVGCHAQIKVSDHPGNVKPAASARQFALAKVDTCRACHGRVFKTYEASAHAIRLRAGNTAAPVCGDCHRPHLGAPVSVQDQQKEACLACHGDTAEQHEQWLPNAPSHLRAVACSACHVPDVLRKVDLRIFVGAAPLIDRDGSLQFERRARVADANQDGLDASELSAFLADLERDGGDISLRGRIELRSGTDAHEIPGKARAIRDCVKCHDENAAPFQNVTISILDAEGRPVRYDAHKAVLSSPMTWEALRSFYAIGGTRLKLLDIVLLLGLVGGIAVPALHLAVRRLFRRRPNSDGTRQ
jgi:predicted CXXCH cytochrome family protein